MKRRLSDMLTLLSLALCVVAAGFWASGATWAPSAVWHEQGPLTETWRTVSVGQRALNFETLTPSAESMPGTSAAVLGFGFVRCEAYALNKRGGPNIRLGVITSYFVPLWFIVAATAVLPVWRLAPVVRARLTIPPGHCRACGYDLRATPERCPECGTTPAR